MHGGMRLLPNCTTLAEVLSEHGFKTVAFHSNPFLSKSLGWGRGFSEFYDFMDIIKSPSAFVTRQQNSGFRSRLTRLGSAILQTSHNAKAQRFLKRVYYKFSRLEIPYLEAKKLNEYVMGWIKRNLDEKFFLWMHYMDPHYPYVPPEEYLCDFSNRKEAFDYNLSANYEAPSDEEMEIFRDLYVGELRYTDACIGELLEYLDEKRLMDDSLILLLGDHGHAFMEHGRFGHAYDILYNEVLHVLLMIFGLDQKRRVDSFVQLLDVPPIILDVLNIRKPPSFMGQSLFNAIENPKAIFSESAKPDLINLKYDLSKKTVSCIKGKFKLVLNELVGTKELYDLEKDPQERNNLSDVENVTFKELLLLINKHLLNECIHKMKLNKLRK
jgi:arylsulfatase A-like enzyme